MKLLTEEQLAKLNTKRLLAYRDSLLSCHSNSDWDVFNAKKITKDSLEWKIEYELVKKILSTREHID